MMKDIPSHVFFGFSQLTPMFEAMGQWAGWRGVSSTNPGGGGERLECQSWGLIEVHFWIHIGWKEGSCASLHIFINFQLGCSCDRYRFHPGRKSRRVWHRFLSTAFKALGPWILGSSWNGKPRWSRWMFLHVAVNAKPIKHANWQVDS